MNIAKRLAFSVAVAIAFAAGTPAQVPPPGAWLSGNAGVVSPEGISLQGLDLIHAPDAKVFTVDPSGLFTEVPFASIAPGDPLHGRIVLADGKAVLLRGFVGDPFFWRGVVTAVNTDSEGMVASFEVDGMVTLHASQARVVAVEPGNEGNRGMDDLLDPVEGIPADLIRVGATVGAGGIVRAGTFAAAKVNVAAITFRAGGKVSDIVLDDAGHLAGFTLLPRSGDPLAIAIDGATVVLEGHRPVPPDTLKEGSKVKVDGWTREDGTVLAREIRIERGRDGDKH